MRIIYEMDSEEDAEIIKGFQNVNKYYFALDQIYDEVRSMLKHGNEPMSDKIEQLLERVKSEAGIIHEDG